MFGISHVPPHPLLFFLLELLLVTTGTRVQFRIPGSHVRRHHSRSAGGTRTCGIGANTTKAAGIREPFHTGCGAGRRASIGLWGSCSWPTNTWARLCCLESGCQGRRHQHIGTPRVSASGRSSPTVGSQPLLDACALGHSAQCNRVVTTRHNTMCGSCNRTRCRLRKRATRALASSRRRQMRCLRHTIGYGLRRSALSQCHGKAARLNTS